jgi:hypothetical protein
MRDFSVRFRGGGSTGSAWGLARIGAMDERRILPLNIEMAHYEVV